jgi:allantoicase
MSELSIAKISQHYINVADERLGAQVLYATDDFFARKERLLQPTEPESRIGVYDENGKWMDGWESRRRRDAGHDYCVIMLSGPSLIEAVEIDTRHFTGNFPPFASIEACRCEGVPDAQSDWMVLLPQSALAGDKRQLFPAHRRQVVTHLKLNIFPDGGVARLRAYGLLHFDWKSEKGDAIDLAAALRGGRALACSDAHYGSMHNVLLPGRAQSMADGWETRRRREPGYDWVVLQLGHPGTIREIEIDTGYFKGNFPHQVSVQGILLDSRGDAHIVSQSLYWPILLEPQYLQADSIHRFAIAKRTADAVSHVRVNIHPDGGLNRVRLFGEPIG